jgi:DNA repair exonuclease SbcCD ATPase subunit
MAENSAEEISREKLERELKGIEDSIESLEDRVSDLEDKDMMAELETLSMEEEVQEIEEILNHMDKEALEKRLNMVEQIKQEYQEGRVHEKLEYLYEQIKELRKEKEGEEGKRIDSQKVDRLESKFEELEKEIENIKQKRDNIDKAEGVEISSFVKSSDRFEIEETSEGNMVKLK